MSRPAQKKQRSHHRTPRRMAFEPLEQRALLAVSCGLTPEGALRIRGTSSADYALVQRVEDTLQVCDQSGKVLASFAAGGVKEIRFQGYAGDDTFVNDTAISAIAEGSTGNDRLEGGSGADTLDGGAGNDFVHGHSGNDVVLGSEGNDRLFGGQGDDRLEGGAGHDAIYGWYGNDELWGGDGNDYLEGRFGDDHLYGQAGKDNLDGGTDTDFFDGGADFDTYRDDFDPNTWVRDGYSRFDVIQGESGTCVINAAMAEAAEGVNLSAGVTRTGDTYRVRLINAGKFVYQSVFFDGTWNDNDSQPGQFRNSDGMATGKNNGEFWTVLYQRAFLSYCGTDSTNEDSMKWTSTKYNCRDHQRALYAITGWTTTPWTIVSNEPTSTAETMRKAILGGDLMTAGGTGHAYAVVDVYQNNGAWKVKLYNPWGRDATHQTMSFAHGTHTNDGEITLDWKTFRANFTYVFTAHC